MSELVLTIGFIACLIGMFVLSRRAAAEAYSRGRKDALELEDVQVVKMDEEEASEPTAPAVGSVFFDIPPYRPNQRRPRLFVSHHPTISKEAVLDPSSSGHGYAFEVGHGTTLWKVWRVEVAPDQFKMRRQRIFDVNPDGSTVLNEDAFLKVKVL